MYEVVRTRQRGFPHEGWVWEHVVDGFENAMVRAGFSPVGSGQPNRLLDAIGRVVGRLAPPTRRVGRPHSTLLIGLMGWKPRLGFPAAYLAPDLAMYVWDCWPEDDQRWRATFRSLRPSLVIFASSAAAQRWSGKLGNAHCVWLGEGIDPSWYTKGRELRAREVDVLEFGRRYDDFHKRALDVLNSHEMNHLYPTQDRPHLFATAEDLAEGLASSKVLICYPASITHPSGRAGGIETMTHRYLEAIASRTLVVGKVPQEMIDMFGFVPGVDLALDDVDTRLPDIISNIADYQDIVDRAYNVMFEVATWDVRAGQIRSLLDEI